MPLYTFNCVITIEAADDTDAENILIMNIKSKKRDDRYGIVGIQYQFEFAEANKSNK